MPWGRQILEGCCISLLHCVRKVNWFVWYQLLICIVNREIFMSKHKPIPKFTSEAAERSFWETQPSTDYLDWSKARQVALPNLKPSTKTISLRLPEGLLDQIKIEANKQDTPYQSLIKTWLAENVGHNRSSWLNTLAYWPSLQRRAVSPCIRFCWWW